VAAHARPDRLTSCSTQRAPQLYATLFRRSRALISRSLPAKLTLDRPALETDQLRISTPRYDQAPSTTPSLRLPHRRIEPAEDALGAKNRDGALLRLSGARASPSPIRHPREPRGAMLMKGGKPSANMFAAGEIYGRQCAGQGLRGRHRHEPSAACSAVSRRERARNAKN